MIMLIATRELKSLLRSPLAWAALCAISAIQAWLFLIHLEQYDTYRSQLLALTNPPGVTELVFTPLFAASGLLMMMVLPLITMRSFAEQQRDQTLVLLTSAPVALPAIVVGKFAGLYLFTLLLNLPLLAMPLSLTGAVDLDWGLLGANMLALGLLCGAFVAVGLWASSLTRHPAAAVMISFALLLGLWLLESAAGGNGAQAQAQAALLPTLSTLTHFRALLSGWVGSGNLIYFLLLTALPLGLTILRLQSQRLTGAS